MIAPKAPSNRSLRITVVTSICIGTAFAIFGVVWLIVLAINRNRASNAPAPPFDMPSLFTKADATKESARRGDLEVFVVNASIGPVSISDPASKSVSFGQFLVLKLKIINRSETKKISYLGWGFTLNSFEDQYAPRLIDNFLNAYRRPRFQRGTRVVGQVTATDLVPGEEITDLLVFDRPTDRATSFQLELPASAFGGDGAMLFTIPRNMIQ